MHITMEYCRITKGGMWINRPCGQGGRLGCGPFHYSLPDNSVPVHCISARNVETACTSVPYATQEKYFNIHIIPFKQKCLQRILRQKKSG